MSRSTSKNDSESNSSTSRSISVRSSYFQTEFSCSRHSDGSPSKEDNVSSISRTLSDKLSCEEKEVRWNQFLTKNGQQKVSKSVQADHIISDQEESLPRERKRWIRPPLVGQASSIESKISSIQQPLNTSESEDDETVQQHSKRTEYTSSDQSLPPADLSELQRIPTPSSVCSLTSGRPLEWDSGADVGYFQQYNNEVAADENLSSIERLALSRGTNLFKRAEPEGKSCSKHSSNITAINLIGHPSAESTPMTINTLLTSGKNSLKKCSTDKPKKYHSLYPEVIIETKGNISDSNSDLIIDETPVNSSMIKKFNSLENINSEVVACEQQPATFPRSQSQSNLLINKELGSSNLNLHLNLAQSVSSSSVATVVTKHDKTSKSIQTSLHQNHAATQSCLLEENKPASNLSTISRPDSTVGSGSGQLSNGDRVNSFEYLPGEVYEQNVNDSNKSTELDLWENTKDGVSLKQDIERGVHLMEEFIQGSNANNTLKKKELIQRVVRKLIRTDYPDDERSPTEPSRRCATRRGHTKDSVVQISPSDTASTLLSENNKLSGSSCYDSQTQSSTWQSTNSESMKSSDTSRDLAANSNLKKPEVEKLQLANAAEKLDWKIPVTKAEKIYEYRKKDSKKMTGSDVNLVQFLNSERENQLDWIVKEINHLSNLKTLLEKHERLKKNLSNLKRVRMKNEKFLHGSVSESQTELKMHRMKRKSNLTQTSHSSRTKDGNSNNKSSDKRKEEVRSQNAEEENGWDSHNYETDRGGIIKKSVSTETTRTYLVNKNRPVAYTIIFDESKPESKPTEVVEKDKAGGVLIIDRATLVEQSQSRVRSAFGTGKPPSLQEALTSRRPDIVNRAEERRQIVAELGALRQLREENREALLARALLSSPEQEEQRKQNKPASRLPPVALAVKRVLSQKEMRRQTEKRYQQSCEVRRRKTEGKLREQLATNRLMKDIFNKKLQTKTLKGQTNLSNSVNIISSS